VPVNSETHFKVVLVSASFDKVRKVARHQEVYKVLSDEMAGEVHALALHTYTPEEWEHKQVAPESPNCLGGSKT
jgi:BolA protein